MNVLQNLVMFYNKLPPENTYRNVCEGILTHLDEIPNSSIYDIADMTNSSRTTIWRMVQKLGYESFSDFHFELKQAIKRYTYYNRLLPEESCRSMADIRNEILDQMHQAYSVLESEVDMNEIERVADTLYHADRVRFYAPIQSSAIYSLQQNLAMTGVNTGYYSLMPEILADCESLTDESIVFVNAIVYAETLDWTEIFKRIKKKQATIFGIMNTGSANDQYIDETLMKGEHGRVIQGVLLFDMHFYLISEVYRMKYIR